ncbi:MAG: efflux RND transporter periplasmic adaptor subunit [Bacteroidales bacterium]|nr:efflux RND transporter periplasmic adaptor subunit [Bacteroidales bacterium]
MHIKNHLPAAITVLSFVITGIACNHQKDKGSIPPNGDTVMAPGLLKLSPEQIEMAGIVTGKIEERNMGVILECSGKIEAPPENIADVTVCVGGLVKSCPFYPGDYVSAGQCIAVLEHPDYVTIQQEFLEAESQWEYYKEDFKRQGELTVENAASVKAMQQAQASFRSTEVKMFALKSRLELLGIKADSLTIDNISSTVSIKAPISGHISKIDLNIGKYVGPEQRICEIINKTNLYLHLLIYEKDIHLVSKDQPVAFSLVNNHRERYKARVKAVSPKIDESNNAFNVYAYITNILPVFKPGMYVKAFISTAEHPGLTLPVTAVVADDDEHAVFVQTSVGFQRVVIRTGITVNDRVEILDYPEGLPDTTIVLSGTYYLNAAWTNRE